MEEKKSDKKPTSPTNAPLAERLKDAEQSQRQKGKKPNDEHSKAQDFLNRRR